MPSASTAWSTWPVVDIIWGLDFGWFVILGLLGAIGDIPGMTARDTLLPEVVKRDGIDLQRFLGIAQSLESMVTIIGPALAALLIGFGTDSAALWVTAALSLLAALITLTLPRSLGRISNGAGTQGQAHGKGVLALAKHSLTEGVRVLFKEDAILRTSMLLTFGIVMVLGSFQGLVLPFRFTELGEPALLGYVLSAMSAGLLVGSLAYTALAKRASKRAWFAMSLVGMAVAVCALGLLPPYPVMFAAALFLGFSAGPASALLGFFAYDRIPADRRGSALGTQNALMLVAAPVAVFAISVVVEVWGVGIGAIVLTSCWLAITIWALATKTMRNLG